jgi:short chain dehydrogenase
MWQTILLSLAAGAMAANATPHFVKGITNEAYPNVVGGSPVSNLVAGWAGFVLTALLVSWAHAQRHPIWAFASGALGVLLMGLFHASGRTIGTTSHRGTHPIPPTETRHEGSHTATSEQQTTRQPPSGRTETLAVGAAPAGATSLAQLVGEVPICRPPSGRVGTAPTSPTRAPRSPGSADPAHAAHLRTRTGIGSAERPLGAAPPRWRIQSASSTSGHRPARGDSRASGWSVSVGRQPGSAGTAPPGRVVMSKEVRQGATALVTGASRGFGRGIATALSRAGAKVAGLARDRGPLEDLRAALGESFTAVAADAADPTVAGQLIDAYDPSILVLNAGASPLMRPLQHHTWQTFSRN